MTTARGEMMAMCDEIIEMMVGMMMARQGEVTGWPVARWWPG